MSADMIEVYTSDDSKMKLLIARLLIIFGGFVGVKTAAFAVEIQYPQVKKRSRRSKNRRWLCHLSEREKIFYGLDCLKQFSTKVWHSAMNGKERASVRDAE